MKKSRIVAMIVIGMIVIAIMAGCSTPSTITTYDKDGKIVTVENADRDAVDKITASTKDKTIIVWRSGWLFFLRTSMATLQNPTPTGEISGGKVDEGYMSVHKDHKDVNWDGVAKVIAATNKNLSVTTSGITETDSKVSGSTAASAASALTDSDAVDSGISTDTATTTATAANQ